MSATNDVDDPITPLQGFRHHDGEASVAHVGDATGNRLASPALTITTPAENEEVIHDPVVVITPHNHPINDGAAAEDTIGDKPDDKRVDESCGVKGGHDEGGDDKVDSDHAPRAPVTKTPSTAGRVADKHPGPASNHTTTTSTSSGEKEKQQQQAAAPQKPPPPPLQQPAAGTPAPPQPQGPPIPDVIVFRKNPDKDDFGFRAVLEAATNPQMFSWFRAAFRQTAFVSFPMFTIAIHPNTMFKLGFPQMLIASVISTSTFRPTLGEQIGLHSWCWRGVTFMLVLGTVFESWNIVKHVDAWWGLIALGIFLAGLCTHGGMRRFMFLYFFVHMMEMRMFELYFGAVPVNNAAWLAADMYMGTFFGIAASLFPYPVLTSSLTDMILGKLFEGMGKMVMGMQSFVVSPMVHAAVVFYSDPTPFQKVEEVLAVMSPLLWFANWEPPQFAVRNPIRRLKLSLLRRIMALMYAAFSVGQEVARLRREMADQAEMQRIRMEVWMHAHGNDEEGDGGNTSAKAAAGQGDEKDANLSPEQQQAARERKMARDAENAHQKFFTKMKEVYGEDHALELQDRLKALRANTNEYFKVFTGTLMHVITLIGKTKNLPENIVKEIPFSTLAEKELEFQRNRRLEVLQVLNVQSRLVQSRRRRRQEKEHKQKQRDHPQQHVKHGSPGYEGGDPADFGNATFSGTVSNMSVTMTRYAMEKEDAMEILDYQDVVDDMAVYLGFQEMFFSMLLSMISGELIVFGDMMATYKPEKGLCQRLFEFFILESWNDFWSALWGLLHLDAPSDIRTIKDALKMTSAFLAACAFNFEIWIPTGGMYFFGTTILLGLPVEEESLGISVCRMAGNTLGCALGYLAYHNTKNLSEMIGLILCFAFVCQCARNHSVFGQCFFYAGFISMAGMATSVNTLELLVRVLASCYTVMAYMLCCMFVFPTNPSKILWGYRMKLSKVVSETLDDVAITARLPLLTQGRGGGGRADNRPRHPYGLGSAREEEEEPGSDEDNADGGDDDALLALTMRSVGQNDNGVDHMLAQLNVGLALSDKLLAMCTKWTPFAAAYPVMRGTQMFPKTASLQVHGAHTKMVASLRLLVFGTQLLHRPRTDSPHPALKRLLSGSVADFLNDFSNVVRLIFQNFVDSLQTSRTWSYPVSLVYHGMLMKLRVRLRAILYETYVLIGIPAGRGTLEMNDDDIRRLIDDTKTRGQGQPPPPSQGGEGNGASAHRRPSNASRSDRDSELARCGGVRVGDDATPQGGSTAHVADSSASFARDGNASFADQYLLARRVIDEMHHHTNDDGDGAGEGGPRTGRGSPGSSWAEPSPRTMDQLRQSVAGGNLSFSADARRQGAYQHCAALREGEAAPRDMFPFTANDAEKELATTMRHEEEAAAKKKQHKKTKDDGAEGSNHGSEAGSGKDKDRNPLTPPPTPPLGYAAHQPDYDDEAGEQFAPVGLKKTPSKLATAVTHLVKPHEDPAKANHVPKYQGPGFSYREDELDLPVDTDFLAMVAILSSCGTFMDDVQSLSGPVNDISGYQKQLHETSLCLGVLDKLSNCAKGTRKENYDRYHSPPPPPEKRTHMNAQTDMWRDWRF